MLQLLLGAMRVVESTPNLMEVAWLSRKGVMTQTRANSGHARQYFDVRKHNICYKITELRR